MPEQDPNIATIFQNPGGLGNNFPASGYLKKIKHPLLTGFVVAGLFSIFVYAIAGTPGVDEPFLPGFTLNPGCAPGSSVNCTVYAPVTYSGANQDINLNGHSITNATGTFGMLHVGGYSFPTSAGGSGQVMELNASGTLDWTNPSATSVFLGLTTSPRVATGGFSYVGDTGYKAGDHMCSAEPGLSGSHMCSTSEILYTISTSLSSLATSGFAWINGGAQGNSNDCLGHSPSADADSAGSVWIFDNSGTGGTAWLTDCNLNGNGGAPIPLACCK